MEKKTMGAFIAALRKANGMTQQEVADRLCVSNKAVSRWERDECAPDVTLIPALAELLGVTCDELLKGERIFGEPEPTRSEPKVEKQLKALVGRAIDRFKTRIWISLALSFVGLVCMFGVSYGFFRPVIGFAVLLLFAAAAFVLAAIGTGKLKDTLRENDLFESADPALVRRVNDALGFWSYLAFFAILGTVALSLPFLFFRSDYTYSVLTFESYLPFGGAIAAVLILLHFACRDVFVAWITEQPYLQTGRNPDPLRRILNLVQFSLLALAGLLFVLWPYFSRPYGEGWSWGDTLMLCALILLAANLLFFALFLCIVMVRGRRRQLLLPGLRNLCLTLPALLLENTHSVVWQGFANQSVTIGVDGQITPEAPGIQDLVYQAYHVWNPTAFWMAVAAALLIFAAFRIAERVLRKRAARKNGGRTPSSSGETTDT